MTGNQTISHMVDSRSFIPIVKKCTTAVSEDLRLQKHSLVHLTVAPVASSWYHPTLYVAVIHGNIVYARTWFYSVVSSYSIMFIWYFSGSVFDISDPLHPSASLTFLYVIFKHIPVRSWLDDPLCIFQSFILVYLVGPLVLDMRTFCTFSEHGYACLRQCFFLISFCGLAGWTLVKSFSVFDRFPFHVLA